MNISLDQQDICSLPTSVIESLLFLLDGGQFTVSYGKSVFRTTKEFLDFIATECPKREQMKIDILNRAKAFHERMKKLGL